jgi:hypothetical protein
MGLLLTLAACLGLARAPLADTIRRGQLTRSDFCGECHRDIYRMWRASAHANAMEDSIFLDAYRAAEAADGPAVTRKCLKCHAPTIDVSGDTDLREKITWEGVTCDVCHSLVSVDLSGLGPRLTLDVGPVKRGPIRDAASTAHEVAYSELHSTSLACAGCHEYVNPEGTPIITTFSEWRESAAGKNGKTCQSCHMGAVRANVVDPRVARAKAAEVNLHEMPGGHSLDQLHKALGITIRSRREGDDLFLDVGLANKGAGHAVPTGMPGRRVILEVRGQTSQGGVFEEQRVYTKTFTDAAGSTIRTDGAYFGPSVRMVADTRIQPDERRGESFRFPVPAAATAFVTVKLHYEHAPTGGADGRTWLTFQSESRTFPPVKTSRD